MASTGLGEWHPLTVNEVALLLAGCGVPWWVAGGWSIDLRVGYQTREHADIDILFLRRDQHVVREHLAAWDVHAAEPPGSLRPWPVGETLPDQVHDIWCRRSPSGPWSLQLILDETEGDEWLFRRDHRVRRSIESLAGPTSSSERAVLSPDVQLLYKSREMRPKDDQDLSTMLPVLAAEERAWLSNALVAVSPGHPWIARLSSG